MKSDLRYLSERLQAATENAVSLLVIALLTGFFLSITANVVTEYVTKLCPRWLWFSLSIVLTLLPPTWFFYRVYCRGYSTSLIVEIVMPFHVTNRNAEILIADAYPVTKLMRSSFHEIMRDSGHKATFLKDWFPQERPFQGMVRQCVKDLLVRAVLSALREHSKQTLTVQRLFTSHRWQTPKLPVRKVEAADWPKRLKENLCFQPQMRTAPKAISIPEAVTLDILDKRDADGMERTEILLKSQYGSLTIAVSPYAQRIKKKTREWFILHRYCGVSQQTDLWLAKFYVYVSADFGSWRVFTASFREEFLPWVEALFECMEQEVDWQFCLKGNAERTIQKIAEQLESSLSS